MDEKERKVGHSQHSPRSEDISITICEELEIDNNGEFEKLFPSQSEAFAEKISNAFMNLFESAEHLKERYPKEKRNSNEWRSVQYSWMLLLNAANALIAGFVIVKKGYLQEPFAIARVAMERLMCAVLMHDNPEIIPEFEAGKQERLYAKGVGAVSKVISDFGKIWGNLSTPGSHVSRENISASIADFDGVERNGIRVGGFFGKAVVERRVRDRIIKKYFVMVELLEAAPEQVFFNDSRTKATLPTNKIKIRKK